MFGVETSQLTGMIHTCTGMLLVPVLVVLVILCLFSLFAIGSICAELITERRHYKIVVPTLLADVTHAPVEDLPSLIEQSALIRSQKNTLIELISYLNLPKNTRYEVAKRLLAQEAARHTKKLTRTSVVAKVAPMLGLMGTLIPLGPGLLALSTGDVALLSSSLMIAFDTTILGLASAVVCFVISCIRKRWYSEYSANIESVMVALLERMEQEQDCDVVEA